MNACDLWERSTYHESCLLALAIPPAILAIPRIARACVRSSSTSLTLVPLPRATRAARLFMAYGRPSLSSRICQAVWSISIHVSSGLPGSINAHENQTIRIQLVRTHRVHDIDHPLQFSPRVLVGHALHRTRHSWDRGHDLRHRSPVAGTENVRTCRSRTYRNLTHMLINVVSCSRQSRRANFPSSSFLAMAFCLSGLAIATSCLWIGRRREHDITRGGKGPRGSYICSNNPCISPMPRSLEMKGEGTNRSRSLKCSPTPKKMIGVLVAATLYEHKSQARVISARPV